LLFYLGAHIAFEQGTNSSTWRKRLWGTNLPYWLLRTRTYEFGYVFPGAANTWTRRLVNPTDFGDPAYKTAIEQIYDAIRLRDPYTAWAWQDIDPGSFLYYEHAGDFIGDVSCLIWEASSLLGSGQYPWHAVASLASDGTRTLQPIGSIKVSQRITPGATDPVAIDVICLSAYWEHPQPVRFDGELDAFEDQPLPGPVPGSAARRLPNLELYDPDEVALTDDTSFLEEKKDDDEKREQRSRKRLRGPRERWTRPVLASSADTTEWFFYSSRYDKIKVSGQNLTAGSAINDFFNLTQDLSIGLDAVPTATNDANVLPTDDLMVWFGQIFPKLTFTVSGDSSSISGFRMVTSLASNSLTFDSESFEYCMTPIPGIFLPPSSPDGVPGLFMDMMVLGLSPTNTAAIDLSFKEVADDVYQRAPNSKPAVIDVFDDLSLHLYPDKSAGGRNCIWFTPASKYSTVQRLEFLVDTNGFLSFSNKVLLDLISSSVIVKQTKTWENTNAANLVGSSISIIIIALAKFSPGVVEGGDDALFQLAIDFEDTNMILSLTSDGSDLGQILTWLGKIVTLGTLDLSSFTNILRSSNAPLFRRATVSLDSSFSATTFSIDIEQHLDFGSGSDEEIVSVLFTFTWTKGGGVQLRGSLWFGKSFANYNASEKCTPILILIQRRMLTPPFCQMAPP